ncbi:Aromatic amino acid aminotransferase II [Yamadazyma tenuis]|uniref:Aromatic amino acid aminotransferase II n=1 Tax=Candida tenuis (strain ATCC 10573 / BCRC 21748 / CBS 615 / JCM 9827 / NBRC 10315 / NRRL Y-1498 / VKM Y-70) TaxID=590646 RepID=G3B2R1_CANTC|nr:uncharacterized protein CANTEDRAFT_120671 [Yamadazyma tenuis ATCC 10573]XP_006685544.1 aromatic amino acid aminotransferase II [Yamadazyma tenuis ATCC 10573]EGV64737.1 hypothetical protein CANTEDRAFT_120671 [Yamadazyma tenuis ATCC 10573]EGV64738.1 aromatic amino acid aminotransferase II [Yamadazyma tenuis ATCC 10573]WEJ97530.1 Aromatic amino acid aminotransferase II [Yamadazyma tenuis]
MTVSSEYSLEHLISKRAAGRKKIHFATALTEGAPHGYIPHKEPLYMSGGMPNVGFFPVDSISVGVADYPFQKQFELTHSNGSLEALSKDLKKLDVQAESTKKVEIAKIGTDKNLIDIRQGLQYSHWNGMEQLLEFTKDFITRTHPPAHSDWSTILTTGAGDGILKCMDSVLDKDDVVLMEEFTFTPSLMMIRETGATGVPIKLKVSSDSEGIDLEYLTDLLENWETLKPGLKKPKALYTIPTGQNPTGLTQSLEFRKKIYALAEKYDFIIIEDDPYGYLTLPPFKQPEGTQSLDEFLTVDEYIKDHLTPSYLEIDTSARVLRIETFSKLFAPGLRVGFIVGHKRLIDVIAAYSVIVTKFPSGVAQTVLQNVLFQKFGGVEGWLQWILKLRSAYIHRRNLLLHELTQASAYQKGLIDVIDPQAGMFVSVVLKFPEGTDVSEKITLLNWKFSAYGVSVVPGLNMAVDKEFSASRGNFYRLTFVPLNTDAEVIEGAKRFAAAVDDFFAKGLEF